MIASSIISALDSSLALSRAGIFVTLSLCPQQDDYADLWRTVWIWCEARQASIEVHDRNLFSINVVKLDGHDIAHVHVPRGETVVVDVDALRQSGAL